MRQAVARTVLCRAGYRVRAGLPCSREDRLNAMGAFFGYMFRAPLSPLSFSLSLFSVVSLSLSPRHCRRTALQTRSLTFFLNSFSPAPSTDEENRQSLLFFLSSSSFFSIFRVFSISCSVCRVSLIVSRYRLSRSSSTSPMMVGFANTAPSFSQERERERDEVRKKEHRSRVSLSQ